MAFFNSGTEKLFCRKCGWSLVYRWEQDELKPWTFVLGRPRIDSCPRCGSQDLGTGEPTLFEKLNTVEKARSMFYKIKSIDIPYIIDA